MRNGILWLTASLAAVLLFAETSLAQPPGGRGGQRGGQRGGPRGSLDRVLDKLDLSATNKQTAQTAVRTYQDNVRRLTDLASAELVLKLKDVVTPEEFTILRKATEKARASTTRAPQGRNLAESDMVERIMSFDKNKDGKITKDELPERMQNLIAKGDTNKDGVLDKDEVKKLAAVLTREESGRGRGGFAGRGGPGGRGGPAARGGRPGVAGRGDDNRLTLSTVERAVRDLGLSGTKKDAAATAVQACKENVRKLTELARADLLLRVSGVMNEEQIKKFKVALDR